MSNFDLIDKYFSNELDKAELKEFNDRLVNNPEFNQEFQEIKEIKHAVKMEARKEIKSLFTDIEDSMTEQLPTNNQTAMKKVFTVAASLILLISASYFVLNGSGQPSPKEVFTEFYQPYTYLNGQVRGATKATESISASAYNAYDAGNFGLAVEKFEALVEVEKTAENYFYMGLANMEVGNFEAALNNLNTTLNNFSTYKDQSKWYISMALLATDKKEEAISTLVSLAINKGSYKAKSERVIEELGLTLTENATSGGTTKVDLDPDPEGDVPDGSFLDKRQVQYGQVIDFSTNQVYRFHNEFPIQGLKEGDVVSFWKLKEARGKKGLGWAFIIDKVM